MLYFNLSEKGIDADFVWRKPANQEVDGSNTPVGNICYTFE